MFTVKKPIFGSNYYPEAWDRGEIDKDLDRMQEMGLNCVRIAEFAWKTMEPEEGRYDFSLFREVVDKCRDRGISVIMGTPTACPPRWLEEKRPELLATDFKGVKFHHGARRNVCPNDPVFREYCVKITEAMAKEFCRDENIIGWQIDNEIDPAKDVFGCCCPICTAKFREYEKKKYGGDIDALNREWGNYVFSQQYDDFSQLDHPYPQWNHPSFVYNWSAFQVESQHEFIKLQYDTLKKYVTVPIGTDMMPTFAHDYDMWAESADVMQFNQYFFGAELPTAAMWYDFMRTVKPRPFWLTETSCCWNGGTVKLNMRPAGFNLANVFLAYSLGAETVNYWLWRAHYGGQELEHGACTLSSGAPSHVAGEIKQLSDTLGELSAYLNGTKPDKSGIAVHVSTPAANTFRFQGMVPDFNYHAAIGKFHSAIRKAGFRPDLIVPSADLADYNLIFTPCIPDLTDRDLITRATNRVKEGATWVVGPLSDNRNRSGAKPTDRNLVHLERLADVKQLYILPADEKYTVGLGEKTFVPDKTVYEVYECGEKSKPLAKYLDGAYTAGKTAIAVAPLGKGKIIVLGVIPEETAFIDFVGEEAKNCGITRRFRATYNVACAFRSGEAGEILTATETLDEYGSFAAPFSSVDLITKTCYNEGESVTLAPYGIAVLKKID